MGHFAHYLAGGLAAFVAVDHLGPSNLPQSDTAAMHSVSTTGVVERSRKGDRLVVQRAAANQPEIATVEVVGLRDAAVIYRDRDGRVLFQTDPIANLTVVSRGIALPELTIRQNSRSPVKSIAVESPKAPADPKPEPAAARNKPAEPKKKLPDGCDPSFSPVASPNLSYLTGRCIAGLESPIKLASR
jgi:hypothetical protein